MNKKRQIEAVVRDDRPTDWFDPLYRQTQPDGSGIPWANMETHPSFTYWLQHHDLAGDGKTALVIGCGMGDDAMELATRGFAVTAFDVSAAAIDHCRRRFATSSVQWVVADLFTPPPEWNGHFDFVLEIYTIQSLPPRYEREVLDRITELVAADGTLLVIALVSEEERNLEAGPPWLLTPSYIDSFRERGLKLDDHLVHTGGSRHGDVWISTFTANG